MARLARAGDADATDRLVELARRRLTRIALAMGVTADDVPDLIQEVLVAAWRNLDRFDPAHGSFVGWLVPGLRGRVHNRSRAFGRQRRFLGRLKELLVKPAVAVPREYGAIEARVTLDRLLDGLTERQREVVALYEIDGLSSRETAELLGLSDAGVRSTARDARQRLRQEAQRLELRAAAPGDRDRPRRGPGKLRKARGRA